jgi:hypothetical protein
MDRLFDIENNTLDFIEEKTLILNIYLWIILNQVMYFQKNIKQFIKGDVMVY